MNFFRLWYVNIISGLLIFLQMVCSVVDDILLHCRTLPIRESKKTTLSHLIYCLLFRSTKSFRKIVGYTSIQLQIFLGKKCSTLVEHNTVLKIYRNYFTEQFTNSFMLDSFLQNINQQLHWSKLKEELVIVIVLLQIRNELFQ